MLAGILLIVLPSVMVGGVSILCLLIGDPAHIEEAIAPWRAVHAHAGVWLILALVAPRYVVEANLSSLMKWIVRGSLPIAAISGAGSLSLHPCVERREVLGHPRYLTQPRKN